MRDMIKWFFASDRGRFEVYLGFCHFINGYRKVPVKTG